jgi:pimeloyl-ACP methyl ester carboxylesterase
VTEDTRMLVKAQNSPSQTPPPSRCDSITLSPCHPVTLSPLSAALERWRGEARPGVCDTGRYRCRYYVWGEGPPLVFVHGLCDDALSFVLTAARLRAHFRCVAYDLPTGEGDGARLGTYRHADYVADLFALLDHLGLGRAYLFGSSFGSTIALAALHEQPGRLPRAVLQGGFARRPLAWAEVGLASLARWWQGPMCRLPLRHEILRYSHHGPFARRPPEVWEFFLQRCGLPPMAAVAYRALVLHKIDLRPLLPGIRQPVLVLCGDCDPLVGRACEQALMSGLPDATRVEISDCGHLPMFTHPEVLAELTYRFLTPLPCPAGGPGGEFTCRPAHPLDTPA